MACLCNKWDETTTLIAFLIVKVLGKFQSILDNDVVAMTDVSRTLFVGDLGTQSLWSLAELMTAGLRRLDIPSNPSYAARIRTLSQSSFMELTTELTASVIILRQCRALQNKSVGSHTYVPMSLLGAKKGHPIYVLVIMTIPSCSSVPCSSYSYSDSPITHRWIQFTPMICHALLFANVKVTALHQAFSPHSYVPRGILDSKQPAMLQVAFNTLLLNSPRTSQILEEIHPSPGKWLPRPIGRCTQSSQVQSRGQDQTRSR